MSPPSKPLWRKALVPGLLLLMLIGIVALLLHLRGEPDPVGPRAIDPQKKTEEEGEHPTGLNEEELALVDASRAAIREGEGVAASEMIKLRRFVPERPDQALAYVRYLQPEVDLAIRSNDAASGSAALEILATAIRVGGDEVIAYISSPAYRPIHERARTSESVVLRVKGTRFLDYLSGPAVLSGAIEMLSDESPVVRVAAVGLYGSHAASGAARLKSIYLAEPDARVRIEILRVIAEKRDLRRRESFDIEKRALTHGTTAEQLQAIRNITLYRDHDALVQIVGTLKSDSVKVQMSALRTLQILRDVRSLDAVRELIARDGVDEVVRLTAIQLKRLLSGE